MSTIEGFPTTMTMEAHSEGLQVILTVTPKKSLLSIYTHPFLAAVKKGPTLVLSVTQKNVPTINLPTYLPSFLPSFMQSYTFVTTTIHIYI